MKRCYIFDIDGTIADNKHRTHHLEKKPKDWDSYHEGVESDGVFEHILQLYISLEKDFQIVFCSGRHDGQRRVTSEFLIKNGFHSSSGLYMRKEGDHRPDYVIKLELLAQIRADGFEPIMAFDDRNSVVKMWREAGIPCAQVAEGDF